MSFIRRLLNLGRSNALQRDIDREMAFHIEARIEELQAAGTSRHEAATIARRQFGNRTLQVENTRTSDVVTWADSFLGDVRYGLRALRRAPVFTVVAVASLAMGIGFNTAIYSLIDAVVLRTLPVPHPEELVQVTGGDDDRDGYFTNPLWEQLRDRQTGFTSLAAWSETRINLADGGETRFVPAQWVSGDYFRVFGMQPAVGRLISATDDRRGCGGTVVLGHTFWQSEYGGRRDVVGATLRLSGKPFEIIGALPAGSFTGPEVGREPSVYVPICSDGYLRGEQSSLDRRSNWWLRVIGRREPSLTLAEVSARVKAVAPDAYANTVPATWGESNKADYLKRTFGVRAVEHGVSELRRQYSKALLVLMGTVAILLLIACANIANLLLARAAARQREVAIRMAIGAGRRRMVRQLLTESALLAILGAAAGLFLARWGSAALVAIISMPGGDSPVSLDLSFNWRVLAFTALATTLTVTIFGLIPAWRGTRIDPQTAMKAAGRGVVEGMARGRFTIAKSLVVAQVALSMVLLVGAGLLVGSLRNLTTLDAGFEPEGVLLVEADMRRTPWPAEQQAAALPRVLERARALRGVRAASMADLTPIGGNSWNDEIFVDGFTPKSAREAVVWFNEVSDGYFTTMDIRLLAGRDFGASDVPTSPRVAIIDELTARKFFGTGSPVGKQLRTKSGDKFNDPFTVIGVVESAKYRNLRETNSATIYQAASQTANPPAFARMQLRADGDPLLLVPAMRQMLAELHPSILINFSTLSRQVATSLARERMLALLTASFGAVALALSMLGLYGVMSYAVARRRNEIGVRIALGADAQRVLRMVLGDVTRVVAVGVVLGAAASLASGKLVSSFLFGVTPTEPMVLGFAVATLLVVAIAAGLIPAWRASHVDPVVALRED
jgi:putative ABC transport system permease protein